MDALVCRVAWNASPTPSVESPSPSPKRAKLLEAQPALKVLKEVPPTKGSKVIGVVKFPTKKGYWVDFVCEGKGIGKVSYGREGFTRVCGGLPMRNHFDIDPPIGFPFTVTVPPDVEWVLRVQQ
jgi:hypothetical protein